MFIKEQVSYIIKKMYIKYMEYDHRNSKNDLSSRVVLIMTPSKIIKHPGMVDRFKAMIGMYYIASVNNIPFSILHTASFQLEKYLQPNKVDWSINEEDVLKWSGRIHIVKYDAKDGIPKLRQGRVYHCWFYTGLDILQEKNIIDWETQWRKLFNELFKPTKYLEGLIDKNKPLEPYISVHLRFVNALESFEKGYKSMLTEDEQETLIQKCLMALAKIQNQESEKMIIFSDSTRFLNIAKSNGYTILGVDNIGHVSFESNEEVYDKTFLDFFLISRGKKVYSIKGKPLYNSVFSRYAAIIGNIDYRTVYLDE